MKRRASMKVIYDSKNKEIRNKQTYNDHDSSRTSLKKTFKNIVSHTKKHINKVKPKCKKTLMELAYATAQELASDLPINIPRIIPVPKTGGFLPLTDLCRAICCWQFSRRGFWHRKSNK